MKSNLPFRHMKIKYNEDVPKEERSRVFKRYSEHPSAISSTFDHGKNCSLVEFSCPTVVAESMSFNDHKSVLLEVDLKNCLHDDPMVLYVDCVYNDGRIDIMKREIEHLDGKVLHLKNSARKVLCEFRNLYKSSRALVILQRDYRVKFASKRPSGKDRWKTDMINKFGNEHYQPLEPPMKKRSRDSYPAEEKQPPVRPPSPSPKHIDVVPEPPRHMNMTPTSRRSFFMRIPKDANTEKVIETVFKSLQGFELCKKFKFNCDKEHVYYKMKFSTAENITKALEVLNTFCLKKELKMGEDYYRPALTGPPFSKVYHNDVSLKSADDIYEKFDVKSMLEDILGSDQEAKKRKLEEGIKLEPVDMDVEVC